MRFPWQKKQAQFESVLARLIASQDDSLSTSVTPQNCMKSSTVHAIVTAVSRRLAVTPIHLFEKSEKNGRAVKERLPDHPVAKLLRRPNPWQSSYDFWQDATSTIMRWGVFYSFKSRGATGPIKELLPLHPEDVEARQDENWKVTFRVSMKGGHADYDISKMFFARGPARDFLTADSPVKDVKTAIALEIMAEKFGASFFENGAMPLMLFEFMEGSKGFETEEQEKEFITSIQEKFGGKKAFRSMLVPKGIKRPEPFALDNEKAQFLETRKYQRTVIAGAFGVPPHLVGDLERATFNNVEQQDQDFTLNVIMPIAKAFESAMERDLLTDKDRRSNVVIRFNLDSTLRADFKSRQEGLQIQRINGIINADEWREIENRNPRDDEHGEDYLHPGNMLVDGESNNAIPSDGTAGDQTAQLP